LGTTKSGGLVTRHQVVRLSVSLRVPSETSSAPPDGQPSSPPAAPPDLTSDYRRGELADFFELAPGDLGAALELPRAGDRAGLVAALERHARRLGAPAAALDNIARLAHPEARAVVTGQQTGLLLGPTYTLSKAMTAVRIAADLDSEERPVVPVFWLASQDHDGAEIDHGYLLDGSETLRRVEVKLPADVASGRCRFDSEMLAAVKRSLAGHTPRPPFEAEVMALLSEAAGVSSTFADWFAAQLYRLLGDTGLVLLDPLEPGIAELFAPVLERELQDPRTSPRLINEAGDRLRERGYSPQLGRGHEATNLFVELEDEPAGLMRRTLLRVDGRGFSAGGRSFSRDELLARLVADPASITPAAGLRPITQDHVLPTAVFVLGPGELAYVAQLRGVYRHHGVAMPLAWPRASVTVLEPVAARLLERFGVNAAEFRADAAGVLERTLLARHGHASAFGRAATDLESQFASLLSEVDAIDPTLAGTVRRGRRYLDTTLERLRAKTAAALARKDADSRRQFERLGAHLLPLGQPAERVLSAYSHMLKFGIAPVLDRFKAIEPTGHQELRL